MPLSPIMGTVFSPRFPYHFALTRKLGAAPSLIRFDNSNNARAPYSKSATSNQSSPLNRAQILPSYEYTLMTVLNSCISVVKNHSSALATQAATSSPTCDLMIGQGVVREIQQAGTKDLCRCSSPLNCQPVVVLHDTFFTSHLFTKFQGSFDGEKWRDIQRSYICPL
jgi:hypothetical protein